MHMRVRFIHQTVHNSLALACPRCSTHQDYWNTYARGSVAYIDISVEVS